MPHALSPASARDIVVAFLSAQGESLQHWDPRARADEPDAVHQMRVTVRRLSSALATFGSLWRGPGPAEVRTELAWLGSLLGEARDLEVMSARLETLAGDDPQARVAVARIQATLATRHTEAMAELGTALDSERYHACLQALDEVTRGNDWSARAGLPAPTALAPLVSTEWQRLLRRVEQAGSAPQHQRDRRLHAVRRAARRLRFTAEVVQPVYGDDARTTARAAKGVQDVLGEHQDSVVTTAVISSLAAGDDTISAWGARLLLAEARRRARTDDLFAEAWECLQDRHVAGWMSAG